MAAEIDDQVHLDEELARRLQEQEIDHFGNNPAIEGLRAPLLNGNLQNNQANQREENNENRNIVRGNVIRALYDVQRSSPHLVFFYTLYGLAELCATAIFVSMYFDVECGHDLQTGMIIFSSRFFFVIPLHIWRLRDPGHGDQINRYLSWLNVATLLLFIILQSYVYDSTCPHSPLYTYCLIIIILVYIGLLLPLIILVGLCICAPIILIFFRRFVRTGSGASQNDISHLDTSEYNNIAEEIRTCSICITDFETEETITTLPCEHIFHQECIEPWLRIKRMCPLCRHDINEPMPDNADNHI